MESALETKRTFSFHQKEQILKEHLEDGLSISALSRKHQINAVTLYSWKKMLMTSEKTENLPSNAEAELAKLRDEHDNLKRAFADLGIEKAIIKEAFEVLKKKKNVTPAPSRSPKK